MGFGAQFIDSRTGIIDPPGSRWSVPGWGFSSSFNADLTANELTFIPIVPPLTRSYTELITRVTLAGAGGTVARLGIYNSQTTARGIRPGSLLLDAGTVSVATTGVKTIAISVVLRQGIAYFLALVTDSATAQFQHLEDSFSLRVPLSGTQTTNTGLPSALGLATTGVGVGALPDPAPAPTGIKLGASAGLVRLRDI